MESEWFKYVDETGCSQGRHKKHKTNLEEEDAGTIPNLPRLPTEMVSLEMMIINLTAHGRIMLMKEGMTILMSGMKLVLMGIA